MGQQVRGAPGLYLRGLASEPSQQFGAVAGFVGIAERGPLHRPQPIRSWDEYLAVFGRRVDYAFLPDAVFGFFQNGGKRCFVVRVANTLVHAHENGVERCPRLEALLPASNKHSINDSDGDETIRIAAIDEGRWGNDILYEIRPGTLRNMLLTTLTEKAEPNADAEATVLKVDDPSDLEEEMDLLLAAPDDAFRAIPARVRAVDRADGQVTLREKLSVPLTRGTRVLGQGVRLLVRLGEQTEVFDNLSISPANPRYIATVVNGPDETLPYIERRARGYSILVRVDVADHPTRRLGVKADVHGTLSGGGDGSWYDTATLKDAGGRDSITVVARAGPERAGVLRVRVTEFGTCLALPAAKGASSVVVENSDGLIAGDDLTIVDPPETRRVREVEINTNTVTLTELLNEAHPVGATVTVVARAGPERAGVLRVRVTEFGTRLALPAAKGASSVVVENSDGLIAGDDLTIADPPETRRVRKVEINTNTVTLTELLNETHPVGATAALPNRFALSVFAGQSPQPIEVHRNLSIGDPASPRYFRKVLGGSRHICADVPTDVTPAPAVGEATLIGGRSPGSIEPHWYTGYDGDEYFVLNGVGSAARYGLAALEAVEEVDLVAVPDLAGQVLFSPDPSSTRAALYLQSWRQVLHHAAKCGDRIALIDTRPNTKPADAILIPQQIAEPPTGKFGALYYPWLRISDGEVERFVPPSGFIAGVVAHADRVAGVGRAPANYPLKNVVDLEVLLDQKDQDGLNPAGVNCIRRFEKPALELWGARTLSLDPPSHYVGARRLVIAVKKTLGRALMWAVFEPNGPALWERIRTSLLSHMQTFVAGGATATANANESFFVKCDAETNPPEVSEAGQVVAVVGIAPAAPAEFIVLNITRTAGSVSVSEDS